MKNGNVLREKAENIYCAITGKLISVTEKYSIKKKILIAPVVGIIFIFLMGIVFFAGLIQQRFIMGDVVDKRFRLYQQSSDIVKTVNIVNSNMYKGFVWSSTGYSMQRVESLFAKQMPLLDEIIIKTNRILESEDLEQDERKIFTSVLRNVEEYKVRAGYAKESAIEVGDLITASVILQMGDDQFQLLFDSLNQLMKIEDDLIEKSFAFSKRSSFYLMVFTFVLFFTVLVISVFISINMADVITAPVKKIITLLRENRSWDIDPAGFKNIKAEDETGELARFFAEYITEIKSTGTALVEARDQLWGEMELAKKIQRVLLPAEPELPGYDVSVNMTPADEVGGDYYDIINIGGAYWIVIGDVSGHGVPAGLVMMMLQTAIRTVLNNNPHIAPSELLADINRVLTANIRLLGEDKFVTITILACFSGGRFIYSGLHEDIMIYRADSRAVESIKTEGMWLGIKNDITEFMSDDELVINKGDVLFLYTDGITEAFDKNRNIFSKKRLRELLEKEGNKPADEIRRSVLAELEGYAKHDDVTMIIIRRIE
ncbi:MAG TPA: PP2C family protein-serine/threonine phosphatase [Spirochaetota bacterium]|nr:PP2C family protein-serine/threonine phosphatase [Spirochaetota bacterium]